MSLVGEAIEGDAEQAAGAQAVAEGGFMREKRRRLCLWNQAGFDGGELLGVVEQRGGAVGMDEIDGLIGDDLAEDAAERLGGGIAGD